MKFAASFFTTAAMVGSALGHAHVFGDWVDGTFQGAGAGTYIRQPPSNSPVKDLKSADLRCNVGGTSAVSGSVTVRAGSVVEPEWFHDNR
jgi:lytic cellulose monooxygenase (C1-hydroxylating)